ncbi:MAG TPA: glycoside hydrolase family 127 protein [Terriglobales bacterium]|nr:glycoside hydrolase family 127 protein [Terriglobales bacterium]
MHKMSRRKFVATAAAVGAAAAVPRTIFALQDTTAGAAGNRLSSHTGREVVPLQAVPFPMKDVRLAPGPFSAAAEANRRYLRTLPPDRLLHTFRLTAGLPSSAEPLGDWEKPDCELRGHFAGGHYLSACALAFASSGDEELKRNGDLMVTELAKCQAQYKNGYLSAFPQEFFDRLRDGVNVWAPFYTLHKIMAGHFDMYTLAGNQQALDTLEKMAGWVRHWTDPLSEPQMQRVLGVEYGGMGEVLCNLYGVTGKREYLQLSQRFDKKWFFDPLASHRDELKGLHVNTHIPQVIAAARHYELTGNKLYWNIADYFWDEVTSERSYCTGGTSNFELWRTDPGVLSTQLSSQTTEDCCAYNMMKLTRHLFGWSPRAEYMDYYERVLFNHRMGTIDPETGTTVYYLPLGSGYSKIYAKPFDSFWCCNGTGAEEFAKLTDTIYFHNDDAIFVNLYIASEVSWPEKGLRIIQKTSFPDEQGTALIVSTDRPVDVDIHLRIPYWAKRGSVKADGRVVPAFADPGSYLVLRGPWKNGDRIELNLPMHLHAAPMPDNENLQAAMYGPLVLAARSDEEPKDMWYRQFTAQEKMEPAAMLRFVGNTEDPYSWLEPAAGSLNFRTVAQGQPVTFVPLSRIVHERYSVYVEVSGRSS